MMTIQEMQMKANVLTALTQVWDYVDSEEEDKIIGDAIAKLSLELAKEINGLTL